MSAGEPTTIRELAVLIHEIREDVAEIKEQTIKTNGRVSEIEVLRRVEAALDAERAQTLARDAERRRKERQEQLDKLARRSTQRQWLIGTLIAAAGTAAGIVFAALAL